MISEGTIDSQRSATTASVLINPDMKKDLKYHICPKCHMIHLITFKNYKINLSDCGTKEHNENNLLFEEYKQLLQNETLKCKECGKTNNNMYVCYDCNNKILCEFCKNRHTTNHKIIEYEYFNVKCLIHRKKLTSYCEKCKTNLCKACESEHSTHKIIKFKDMNNQIDLGIQNKINEFKNEIDDIIGKLNKIKENIDYYLKIILNINDGVKYNKYLKNYYIFKNIESINSYNKEIIKDIDEIKNRTNIKEKFNKLNEIYDFMSTSNDSSNPIFHNSHNNIPENRSTQSSLPLLNDDNQNNNNTENNIELEIEMKFKIDKNLKKLKELRIFGDKFIENNNDCQIRIENGNAIYNQISPKKNYIELKEGELDNNQDKNKVFEKFIKIYLNLQNITNLSYMFCNCQNLSSLYISGFYQTNNTIFSNLSRMFDNCTSLESLNIVDFNTSNVIDMSYAFSDCKSLKSLSSISNWNTSKVENMEGMFENCINLETINDISNWNTLNVKNMNYMFCNCQKLTDITPLSNFNFSNVTKMNNIFAQCSNLEDISNFPINNANKVKDISFMFYDCFKLEKLPTNFGFNEDPIINISCMFYNCKKLNEEKISSFLDINHYKNADKTGILKGFNENSNCLII